MSSKMNVLLVLVAVLVSGCHSQSLAKSDEAATNDSKVVAPSSVQGPRVSATNGKSFDSLTSDFVLKADARRGVAVYSEDLSNIGDAIAHILFGFDSAQFQISTRIHEVATYTFPGHPTQTLTRTRVSSADFAVDEVQLTRSSGQSVSFSLQDKKGGIFDLAAGEQVHLEWRAHAKNSELCPFWAHHTYSNVAPDIIRIDTGSLDWSVAGAAAVGQLVRHIGLFTGDAGQDDDNGQTLVSVTDGADSITINQIAGDGTPNQADGRFSCDGLMEELPSN
jgi:hypothetical protein